MTAALESPDALYEAFEPFLSDSDRQLWTIHSEQLLVDYAKRCVRNPWEAAGTADNLPNARLTLRDGEGHLQAFAHLPQMLNELMTVRP
jgi:hypothetical protein